MYIIACPLYVDHCVVCPLLFLYMFTIVLSVPCLAFICWPLCCLPPACPLYVDHCVVCPLLVLYMLTIVLSIPCLSFICWPLCCLSPTCHVCVDQCVVCAPSIHSFWLAPHISASDIYFYNLSTPLSTIFQQDRTWQSLLSVKEIGVPGKKTTYSKKHWSHKVL